MSKIPPGEWNAIAARHAKGESLSAIARSYGCTPPAIHYVLKRNGRQPIEPVEKVEQSAKATPPPSDAPRHEMPPQTLRLNGETKPSPNRENEPTARGSLEPDLPASVPVRTEEPPAAELQPHPDYSRTTGRALASNDGLDSELYGR